MSVNTRTEARLNAIAERHNMRVRICSSHKPARRWYSVGNYHGGAWHQVTGFVNADHVEAFLGRYQKAA